MGRIVDLLRIERIRVSERSILAFTVLQRLMLGILINIIGPIVPLIASDLGIGLDYIGKTISLGTFAVLLTSFSIGYLTEMFGFKRIIFAGILFIISGCVAMFYTSSYLVFNLSYFILQFGIGILGLSTITLIGNHYFEKRTSNLLKANLGLSAGTIIAPLLVSLAVTYGMRWQSMFLYLVLPQALVTIVLISLNIPKGKAKDNSLKTMWAHHKKVLSHAHVVLCCLVALLYVSTTQTFYTWFTSYFSSMDIGLEVSSLFLAGYVLANMLGMVAKNYIVKLIKERKLLLFSASLSFCFLLSAFLFPHLVIKMVSIFLFGASIAGNFSIAYSLALNIGQKFSHQISAAMHASAYTGMAVFQYLAGYFSEHFSMDSIFYIDLGLLAGFIIVAAIINIKRFDKKIISI